MEIMNHSLVDWVESQLTKWRNHYEQNYLEKDEEYDRIYRGLWKEEDRTRDTERSRLVAPATSQAVESSVAEVEEAIFGRGTFFDITDNVGDNEREDVQYLRNKLSEEFKNRKLRRAISEVILNAAITGTGIAEIVLDEEEERVPAEKVNDGLRQIGVQKRTRTICKVLPVHPKHFLIEPSATSIEDALGVAIEKPVPIHQIEILQEKGVYRDDEEIGSMATDLNLEVDQAIQVHPEEQARLTKYYGLVPVDLLKAEGVEVDTKDKYVEAIVIIGNKRILLKADVNPFMMRGRPIIAFQWDILPGSFRGRGVVEKAYNSQKAIEAELRARIDALALTTHPMLAMDATAMPRGITPKVAPGRILLTNGNPRDVLHPFNFGEISQITFPQAESLQRMLQQATGAIDTTGIAGQIGGDAKTGAVSMSLGAIIKRHKRTLVSFQEDFLIPLIKQVAFMYMQYNPDEYPAGDYKFNITGALGIMAREYETAQLGQILQGMAPNDPIRPVIIEMMIDSMSISRREETIARIRKAQEVTPEQQQAQEEARKAEMAFKNSQTGLLEAQAAESFARAKKYGVEMRAVPVELENKRITALSTNLMKGEGDDREFERRAKAADRLLKERELNIKEADVLGRNIERDAKLRMGGSNVSNAGPNG